MLRFEINHDNPKSQVSRVEKVRVQWLSSKHDIASIECDTVQCTLQECSLGVKEFQLEGGG